MMLSKFTRNMLLGIVIGLLVGCASQTIGHIAVAKGVSPSGPLPPNSPPAINSYKVEFSPATNTKYSPTDVKIVKRYKNLIHWPGSEDLIKGDEKPDRPYIIIGKLKLSESWYFEESIHELVNKYVPEYGGDAVLIYEAFQTKAALMSDPKTKKMRNVYYQYVEMDVIRFESKK